MSNALVSVSLEKLEECVPKRTAHNKEQEAAAAAAAAKGDPRKSRRGRPELHHDQCMCAAAPPPGSFPFRSLANYALIGLLLASSNAQHEMK